MYLPFALILTAVMAPRPVAEFALRDTTGTEVRLLRDRPNVVVFLGNDCPMARMYSLRLKEFAAQYPDHSVGFLAVNANAHDDAKSMAAFARDYPLGFPFAHDPDGRVADLLGATRSPQAFVLDSGRRIRYRGRIDDQYAPGGKNRGGPTRQDLAEALREVVAGRRVSVPSTECRGCLIERESPRNAAPSVTYSRDIAQIVRANCQACHRPGEVAPFSLLGYADAVAHAETIAEVVENRTMPPWHAAPEHGHFRNERRLSAAQKKLVADWVRLGCPEGDPAPPDVPPASTGWRLGTPDAVYQIPRAFAVPAEGIIEYQHFIVDPGLKAETWVRAAEVRPSNRRVVHHCSVFLVPPGSTATDEFFETGALGSMCLIAFTPGSEPLRLPEGMAKRIAPGWKLHLIVHYTSVGVPQADRTELALQFLDPSAVRKEVGTKLIQDFAFAVPPRAADYRLERSWTADRDYLLLSMLPHMHLRGKSFRYTLDLPNGRSEILLDVPAYDFNWQHRYELAEPTRVPAGSVIRCTAVYDNSADNPFNPEPDATVRAGLQNEDEMFNGYFEIVLFGQDIPAELEADRARSAAWIGGAAAALIGLWGIRLRRAASKT